MERRVEVDELGIGTEGHLLDGPLNLGVPVACAALEARMAVEDGCHLADKDARLGVHDQETVYESPVVGNELFLPVGPVARVGIVQAQVDDHPVGPEVERLAELWGLHVRAVALI